MCDVCYVIDEKEIAILFRKIMWCGMCSILECVDRKWTMEHLFTYSGRTGNGDISSDETPSKCVGLID
jgi:hypothetical protein